MICLCATTSGCDVRQPQPEFAQLLLFGLEPRIAAATAAGGCQDRFRSRAEAACRPAPWPAPIRAGLRIGDLAIERPDGLDCRLQPAHAAVAGQQVDILRPELGPPPLRVAQLPLVEGELASTNLLAFSRSVRLLPVLPSMNAFSIACTTS